MPCESRTLLLLLIWKLRWIPGALRFFPTQAGAVSTTELIHSCGEDAQNPEDGNEALLQPVVDTRHDKMKAKSGLACGYKGMHSSAIGSEDAQDSFGC